MTSHDHATVTLRPLRGSAADVALLQPVLEGAPTYARLTSGAVAGPHAAAGLFDALPPGVDRAHAKHVFGIFMGSTCVGCIDLIRGYPTSDTAMLGLLLVAEPHQGRGVGPRAFALLLSQVQAWPEVQRLRIGVVETNARVLPFWQAQGFVPTGATRPYEEGSVVSRVVVLERPVQAR